ncbi:MAG: 23S rRNA (adenine(2030)-N(6))-methyltransferase RlmJ [Rhizobiales bacterium]|nr:23S rRNA (adenine(2030)-N(6))-methyltransferase RlmJ [Hyphomicrobiales bacterium]
MLSYQHAYHAGAPADVHKHLVLLLVLARLTVKARPITYMETHAGRGLYDLASPEARKTGEANAGIARLRRERPPFAAPLLAMAGNGESYPGSPLIAARSLRPDDRLHLMELHPREHAALAALMRGDARVAVHRRDGYEGVLAISPPRPNRGLVLIDPSYEIKSEYANLPAFLARLARRWLEAVLVVWYPMLAAGLHEPMTAAIVSDALDRTGTAPWQHELRLAPPRDGHRGLLGSGMLVISPPWGFAESTAPVMHELADFFSTSAA